MKLIVVALALVAVVAAAPAAPEQQIQLVRSSFDQQPDGSFVLGYETSDGVIVEKVGELKQVTGEDGKPVTVLVFRGSYVIPDAAGQPQTITYYADETGYHAEGEQIPKVPARR